MKGRSSQTAYSKRKGRIIPFSYALLGGISASLSILFAVTMYLGIHRGVFLIGLWSNIMLLVASLGLTGTVLAAYIGWRKLVNGHRDKKRKQKA